MTKLGSILAALLLFGAVAACSSTQAPGASTTSSPAAMTGSTAASTAPAAGSTITISGMAFGQPITVAPGATVTIANTDGVEHSVTSNPKGAFDTEVDGGEQKTFTAPTQPGEYPFICKYHSTMKGTLTVK